MTDKEFHADFKRVEAVFNRNQQIDDAARNEYFKGMAFMSIFTFRRLVEYVIQNYRPGYGQPHFPAIGVFMEALAGDAAGRPMATVDELAKRCEKCGDIGWQSWAIRDGVFSATPCDCRIGQAVRREMMKDRHFRHRHVVSRPFEAREPGDDAEGETPF